MSGQTAFVSDDSTSGMEERALSLVNPASGLANDYLNLFNEVLMLIEHLPSMPELFDDLLAWKPTTYQEYFGRSILPGSISALEDYNRLDPRFRSRFEAIVEDLDRVATGAVASIRRHIKMRGQHDPATLASICDRATISMRGKLERAVAIVNHGEAGDPEHAQARADRLLAVRVQALKDVSAFWETPRFPLSDQS